MKKIYFFLVLLGLPVFITAQEYAEVNGLAYDKEGNLLDGKYKMTSSDNFVEEISYKHGLKDGVYNLYNQNGRLIETGAYAMGEKDGKWTKWNETGIKLSEIRFADGLKEGKWQIWDSQGILRCVLFYNQGRKVGTWQMFNETGDLVKEENYDLNF